MLPRLHYFGKDVAGAPSTLGWAFGEGCEEKAVGALKRMKHPEMGTLIDRLERIAETETAYCHEYSLIGPKGFPLVTAGWYGCFQCFKNSEDSRARELERSRLSCSTPVRGTATRRRLPLWPQPPCRAASRGPSQASLTKNS